MIVVWSEMAIKDREEIIEYIAVENVMAAIHMDELFEHAAMLLTDHPFMGHAGLIANTRELIPHENYRLVYEIMGSQVTILTLTHTARLWPPTNLN